MRVVTSGLLARWETARHTALITVHHAITSADHRDTDARVLVFQKPDDDVPDDGDDQAAEAGLDEDDDI